MKNLSLILALVLTLCFFTACAPDNSAELEAKITSLETQLKELENTVNEQAKTIEQNEATLGLLSDRHLSLINDQADKISRLEKELSELEEKKETITQVLNLSNYNEYLSFNVTFSELQRINVPVLFGDTVDRYVCKMTITTNARCPNICFQDATIKYYFTTIKRGTVTWNCSSLDGGNQQTDIAASGFSETTIYLYAQASTTILPNTDSYVPVIAATGTVIINE